ncbi:MAG: hypothetical protein JOZ96_06830 [Acidobacteria bacterium]|nr:hypothetical protein [Acidobacteriota bacterium]
MRPADLNLMKSLALAAVTALLLAQTPAAEARRGFRQTAPFKISSLGTAFGVQVEVEGTYFVTDHYVDVDVERARIYVSEHCPYKGRRLVNTIAVGLATAVPRGGWHIENRGLPVFVEQVLAPREEYRLADLHFRIPRDAAADIEQRWLVVETEETDIDAPEDEDGGKGYAFAHSCRNLFAYPCGGSRQ